MNETATTPEILTIGQQVRYQEAKERRDDLTAKGLCLNGATHGPATRGRLCDWCRAVHTYGVLVVLADPGAPSPPPGYKFRPRGDNKPVVRPSL